jgi:hypothetical protein
MNKITDCIATHQPQHPQNYQYNSNRPQHLILLPDCFIPIAGYCITISAGSGNAVSSVLDSDLTRCTYRTMISKRTLMFAFAAFE